MLLHKSFTSIQLFNISICYFQDIRFGNDDFFLVYAFFNFIKISDLSVIRGESNWIVFEPVNLPVIVVVICPSNVNVGLGRILISSPLIQALMALVSPS
jgi:hypothetical protein